MTQIIVSAEKVAIRDEWERSYKLKKCNLNEALFMCMDSGAPMSHFMINEFDTAISDYSAGKYEDLAEAFGIKESNRERQVTKKWLAKLSVRDLVDYFHELGHVKTDPSSYDDTAFHKAGKVLNKAPSTLFKVYYSNND